MEITLELDGKDRKAKALIAYLKTLDFIKFREEKEVAYDADFVDKIKNASLEKGRVIKSGELWEAIK